MALYLLNCWNTVLSISCHYTCRNFLTIQMIRSAFESFSEMTFQRFCLVIGSLSFFQRIWLIVKFLLVTMPPWEITKILGQSYMLGTRPVGIMIDLI